MKKVLSLLVVLLLMSAAGKSYADSPVSISLFKPLQIVNENKNVKGLRVNLIYGANVDVTGVDVGLINHSYGTQRGFMFGLYNNANDFRGFQLGLINRAVQLDGIQLGLFNLYDDGPKDFVPFVNWKF